jgi:hypothetical protein
VMPIFMLQAGVAVPQARAKASEADDGPSAGMTWTPSLRLACEYFLCRSARK